MSLYLDASVIVPLFIDEAQTVAVDRLLSAETGPWRVSEFGAGEVASAFARLMRTGRLAPSRAEAGLALLDRWRITDCETPRFEDSDIRLAALFVRRFDLKLRMPDALHAATCQRLGLTLVTLDGRLADAAAVLGVAVVVPA